MVSNQLVGKVIMINDKKGWIAVLTQNNTFSLLEVLEMELPEIGDILVGNLEYLGEETIYNKTDDQEIDVFIQEIHESERGANRILFQL